MTDNPKKSDKTQAKRDHLWKKGQSGNPAGRPQGSRNRATLAIEALLDSEGETLTRKAIEMAKGGDATAMRLCLDRIVSPRKDRPIKFELPVIENAADATKASAAIVSGVAAGDITPGEASELSKVIESHVRVLEANEFSERLRQLELKANGTAAL
jgi:hypothetical protein